MLVQALRDRVGLNKGLQVLAQPGPFSDLARSRLKLKDLKRAGDIT